MTRLTNLGAGSVKNCISNMQMERLASAFGPTGGRIVRPSDGRAPHTVAFVQCAGSRDQNHLNYCSYICCMASLKQCLYIAEQNPDTLITVYYIDLRAPGRYVNVLEKVKTLDYDLVVLATGMQPSLAGENPPLPLPLDEDGFIAGGEEAGIFAAGCARMPLDVTRSAQSGTAAALKAVQTVKGR